MTPATGSEPGGEERLDDLIAGYFEARKAAIINVVAHKASPPEYPGLALVPVPDIERLEQFVELPRTRYDYATPPSPAAGGLREALFDILVVFDSLPGRVAATLDEETWVAFYSAMERGRAALASGASSDHFHDPFDPMRHAEWLSALGHKPLPDGRCEHRWRNRITRAVRCAFLEGFRAGLTAPDETGALTPVAGSASEEET